MGLAQVLSLVIVFVHLYDEIWTLVYLCISIQFLFSYDPLVFRMSPILCACGACICNFNTYIHKTSVPCLHPSISTQAIPSARRCHVNEITNVTFSQLGYLSTAA